MFFLKWCARKTVKKISPQAEVFSVQDQEELSKWQETIHDFKSSSRRGALVISGEWGSGKTFVYEKYISKVLGGSGLYVSLYSYGVQGRTIDDLIIQAALNIEGVDEESKKNGAVLLAETSSLFSDEKNSGLVGALVNTTSIAVKRRYVDGLDKVFCFDDIDRLDSEQILKAWSELNHYAEARARPCKIIILLDEKRLPGGSVSTGELEKNVWRLVSLNVSPELALRRAIQHLNRELAEDLLGIEKKMLLPVVQHFEVKNIRLIIKALERIERIRISLVTIGVHANIDPDVVRSIYQKIFILGLVLPKAAVVTDVIKKLAEGIDYYERALHLALRGDSVSTGQTSDDKLLDNIPNFDSVGVSLPFLEDYILSDSIDLVSLAAHVRVPDEPEYLSHPVYLAYKKSDLRGQLTDDEYERFFNDSLGLLSDPPPGQYTLRWYISLIDRLITDTFYESTDIKVEEIESIALSGFKRFYQGVQAGSHVYYDSEIDGIGLEKASDKFRKIVSDLRRKLDEKNQKDKLLISLANWQSDPDLGSLKEVLSSYDFASLDLIGFDALRDFLLQANGRQIEIFNGCLSRRYSVDGNVHVIADEVGVLTKLLEFYQENIFRGYRKSIVVRSIPMLHSAIAHADRYLRIRNSL